MPLSAPKKSTDASGFTDSVRLASGKIKSFGSAGGINLNLIYAGEMINITEKIEKTDLDISDKGQELAQLTVLKKVFTSLLSTTQAIARGGKFNNDKSSIYEQKTAKITSAGLTSDVISTYLSVAVDSSSPVLPLQVVVQQLARNASMTTGSSFTDLTTQTLNNFNSSIVDGQTLTIESQAITLVQSWTLADLMAQINQYTDTTHIAASALTVDNGYRLCLENTALGSGITITASTAATALGLASTTDNYSAQISVNGITRTNLTNTIDLGYGRALTLKNADPTKTFTVTTEKGGEAIQKKLLEVLTSMMTVIQEIRYQDGVDTQGREDEPLLTSLPEMQKMKKVFTDFWKTYAGGQTGYQTAESVGIKKDDGTDKSLRLLDINETLFLKTKPDIFEDLLPNTQKITGGTAPTNFKLMTGPVKGISILNGQEITLTVALNGSTYTASLSGASLTSVVANVDQTTKIVSAPVGGTFEGILIKYLGTLADGSSESVVVKYHYGLMGKLYDNLLDIVNTSSMRLEGALIRVEKRMLADVERAKKDLEKIKKIQESQEKTTIGKIKKISDAMSKLDEAKQQLSGLTGK